VNQIIQKHSLRYYDITITCPNVAICENSSICFYSRRQLTVISHRYAFYVRQRSYSAVRLQRRHASLDMAQVVPVKLYRQNWHAGVSALLVRVKIKVLGTTPKLSIVPVPRHFFAFSRTHYANDLGPFIPYCE